ncbi:MAG: reductase [Marmoricola sp.]|nr:reductase [Marmoricola sp.]
MSGTDQATTYAGGPGLPEQPVPPPAGPPRPASEPERRRLALAGAVAAAAGLVLSETVAQVLGASSGPVQAVAATVRDLTPGPVALFLIHAVGHADKPLLLGGTALVVLGVAAWAGTWVRRRPLVPDLVFVALAVAGLLATMGQPHPGIGSAAGVVVGLVIMIGVLRLLSAPLLAARAPGAPSPTGPESRVSTDLARRAFLVRAVATAAVVAAVGVAGRVATSGQRSVEQARRLLRLPVTGGTVPAGATLGVAGIEPWRSPSSDFYLIHTALTPPTISPADWKLRIHGMVDREITLTYQDLVDRQMTEAWVTLCCVSNEVGGDLIGNAWWSGVLVRDLLREAGVKDGADAVLQTSQDGWTCGTPVAALTDDRDAMLAVAMNGKPLPVEHGFPVRMVVPGLYGYVSATKWLVDLEVTRFADFEAFWTQRGWSEKGPVKTQARIDVPRDGESMKAGKVRFGGSAWAQHTGIEKVEWQLDGGAWQRATLGGVPSDDTWVQWSAGAEVSSGRHTLVVRATDKSGRTQTSVRTDVVPDGASGWPTREFAAT